VSDCTITSTLAISFASALAIDTASPLLPSDGGAMEQSGSHDLMALDRVLALGSAMVSLVSSRNYVSRSQRSTLTLTPFDAWTIWH
jgi:hypothetical protein